LLDPTKANYTFDGWFNQASGGTEITDIDTAANITVYAQWTVVDYTITYDAGTVGSFDTNNNPVTFNADDSFPITLVDPVKSGETFDGWYSDAGLNTSITEITSSDLGSNLTIYAKWII
jgi:uncharacterized repeat protein (TIGR02543 family)